jgi:hypothetical protein
VVCGESGLESILDGVVSGLGCLYRAKSSFKVGLLPPMT